MRLLAPLFASLFIFSTALAKITDPFFYAITKDGRTSYVLGTYHIGIGIEELPALVQEKMESSSQFAGEITLPLEEIRKTLGYGSFLKYYKELLEHRDRIQLGKTLSASDQEAIRSFGVPAEIASRLRYDDGDELCLHIYYARYYFSGIYKSMDLEIQSYALSESKPIVALENSEVREAAFRAAQKSSQKGSSPQRCTIAGILKDLQHPLFEMSLSEIRQSADNYRKGPSAAMPGPEDLSVTYRNNAWVPKILELHQKGTTFISVGASHLSGPGNLLQLLAQKGFKIYPVR